MNCILKPETFLLIFPFQSALAKDVVKSNEEKRNERHHREKPDSTESVRATEINCPGIHKNNFHVEENEENGDEEIFDREWNPGIAFRLDTAFEYFEFLFGFAAWTELVCNDHGCYNEAESNQ